MKKIVKTDMLNRYFFKFVIRLAIFLVMAVCYFMDKERLYEGIMTPMWKGIMPVHILWLMFMFMMLRHIFPVEKLTMALRKSEKKPYVESTGYSDSELLRFVQEQNVRAWVVMLVWLCFNAIFGILYVCNIIDNMDLMMLTVFYFLCDYICILFFCPFQTFIMKNRCCVNCRIYDWGHFMMFTPMLFIRNFLSWSLFFTACIVLIKWEIIYAKHPERFFHGSNKNLQCANCKDKTCQVKKALSGKK